VQIANERHLLQREQAACLLQVSDDDLQWLVNTRQLMANGIGCNQLFDSLELYRLIDSYKRTQSRRLKKP
jgi:hypothetical protein